MRSVGAFVEVALIGLLFSGMLALAACPPTPPPQPDGPPTPSARDMARPRLYPDCAIPDGGALPKTADLCVGLSTPDHRVCARCPVGTGCLDVADKVYCIATSACTNANGSAADPMCRPDTGARK